MFVLKEAMDMPAINENLKLLRNAKGMTQEEVANLISVTRQTISSYESGRTQPNLETLKRLAEVYQADLNDVLYGGNRLQQRMKRVKTAVIILMSIILLGILTHSLLFLTMNSYFKVASGTVLNEDNKAYIDMRFALRDIADTVARICTSILGIGCIAMLYPMITVSHAIKTRKLIILFLLSIMAMFACAIPFAINDKVYHSTDYLMPVWSALPPVFLLFVVTLLAKFIKRRHS
jgi:transcriptional regulator with XRE-family HTH domain